MAWFERDGRTLRRLLADLLRPPARRLADPVPTARPHGARQAGRPRPTPTDPPSGSAATGNPDLAARPDAPRGPWVEAGREGEDMVARCLDGAGHRNLRDVMVPTRTGHAQVDQVALVGRTLVVIETKHLAGRLAGGAGDERWSQRRHGMPDRTLRNPLAQNAGHVAAVRGLVGPSVPIRPLVTLTGPATSEAAHPDIVALRDLPARLLAIAAEPGPMAPGEVSARMDYVALQSGYVDRARVDPIHAARAARADEGLERAATRNGDLRTRRRRDR